MTTAQQPAPPLLADELDDEYPYGWRMVRERVGEQTLERQVPLTLEDVLHPEQGDFIVHTDLHQILVTYLHTVLRLLVQRFAGAIVLNDVRVQWPGMRALGPDIIVIFGVKAHQNWGTFDVADEGATPQLVIEVTSPEPRAVDLDAKLVKYRDVDLPYYIIVDTGPKAEAAALKLLGYVLTPTGYEALAPNARGRLWLEPLRIWIGIERQAGLTALWLYDEHGQRIEDYNEVAAQLTAERQARQAAEQARQAEAQARQVAERARQAAEQAQQAAEQARQAAEQTQQAEAQARAQAEAQVRALEDELRRLRGEAAQ